MITITRDFSRAKKQIVVRSEQENKKFHFSYLKDAKKFAENWSNNVNNKEEVKIDVAPPRKHFNHSRSRIF